MEEMVSAEVLTIITKRVAKRPDGWEADIRCFCMSGCSISCDELSEDIGGDGRRVIVEVYVRELKAWRYGKGSSSAIGRCEGSDFSETGRGVGFLLGPNGKKERIDLKMLVGFGFDSAGCSEAVALVNIASSSSWLGAVAGPFFFLDSARRRNRSFS